MSRTVLGLVLFVAVGTAAAAIKEEAVDYQAEGVIMKGYLAYDDAVKGKRPGVIVVHEWWGLNDYVRSRARMLAEMGYTALAVDMYGGGKQAAHPEEAGKFATEVRKNLPTMRARFRAAHAALKGHKTVDAGRIGAIGYCFGGSVVLEMARAGEGLKAVASFHGNLQTEAPAQKGKVKSKVLVLTGEADAMIPLQQVAEFEKEMKAAGVDYKVVVYPKAKHSFTNPQADAYAEKFKLPLGYSIVADDESWYEMKQFLNKAFGK